MNGVMNYRFYITVHVYAEERLDDRVLRLHSKNYGIHGKDIIAPLRKINGKEYCIKNVQDMFSVEELWKWIDFKLYGNSLKSQNNNILDFVEEYNIVKKYLIFNNLRYTVEDTNKPLLYYLHKMGISETETINIQLLINSDAGSIFEDDGIRYYMHSKEAGKHNTPHVHVDIRHEVSGSFSLIDGKQLSDGKIKKSDVKKIKRMIINKKKEFIKYWNEHTDGLTVDLNQALGLIQY